MDKNYIGKMATAAVFCGANKPFEIKKYPLYPVEKGMALLELESSGVCGTDVHIQTGRLGSGSPAIIGHEFIGKIVDIANDCACCESELKTGDTVIAYIACSCGHCKLCEEGDDANCVNMTATNDGAPEKLFGGYTTYNYTPVANLVKLPDDLDPVTAAVFACAGPTALHAMSLARRANIEPSKSDVAVVQGLGPVGLFSVAYLKASGVKNVLAISAHGHGNKAEAAKTLGADEVISLSETSGEEFCAHVKELSGGLGADLVIECSGSPKAIPTGLDLLRNRGVYLVPGQYSNSGKIEISPEIITFKALRILGSSQYSIPDIQTYIDFLHKYTILHKAIRNLAAEYRVEDANKAFEDIKAGKNIKTMFTMNK